MYLRPVHTETRIPALRQFIYDNPLGVLTTAISSSSHPFIQSSHIPWLLDVEDVSSETELGVLRGHMARANPQSKTMMSAAGKDKMLEMEVLVLFTGSHHYVTPKFYTETKPSTGKVVPTWNYGAVQAYGRAKIFGDSTDEETMAFLSKQINELSRHAETTVLEFDGCEGRPEPWTVKQAPESYIDLLGKAIIGVEITIERLEGKLKMSQELGEGDRAGVIAGFHRMESEVGNEIASLVKNGRMKLPN